MGGSETSSMHQVTISCPRTNVLSLIVYTSFHSNFPLVWPAQTAGQHDRETVAKPRALYETHMAGHVHCSSNSLHTICHSCFCLIFHRRLFRLSKPMGPWCHIRLSQSLGSDISRSASPTTSEWVSIDLQIHQRTLFLR